MMYSLATAVGFAARDVGVRWLWSRVVAEHHPWAYHRRACGAGWPRKLVAVDSQHVPVRAGMASGMARFGRTDKGRRSTTGLRPRRPEKDISSRMRRANFWRTMAGNHRRTRQCFHGWPPCLNKRRHADRGYACRASFWGHGFRGDADRRRGTTMRWARRAGGPPPGEAWPCGGDRGCDGGCCPRGRRPRSLRNLPDSGRSADRRIHHAGSTPTAIGGLAVFVLRQTGAGRGMSTTVDDAAPRRLRTPAISADGQRQPAGQPVPA